MTARNGYRSARRLPYLPLWLLVAACAAVAACGAVASPTRMPALKHRVAVIAHRGGATLAPENTLAAYRNAIALGVDYIEIDVRVTRDGGLVIMHDRTVDRTTNGTGQIANLDLAAVRSLDAGRKFSPRFAGERVPTLEEVLDLCRGRVNLYLDYKEGPIAQIAAVIKQHRMRRQVVVYGDGDELREWKRVTPGTPVMPTPDREFRHAGGLRQFLGLLPAEVLDGSVIGWTPELVAEAHSAGARVFVDNLGIADNEAGFRRAIEMGVDGIQTDHPDLLLRTLRGLETTQQAPQ